MTTAASEPGRCPGCGAEVELASFLSIDLPWDVDLLICAQVADCPDCGLRFDARDPRVPEPRGAVCPACGVEFELPPRPFETESVSFVRDLVEAEGEVGGIREALETVDPDRYPTCPACGFTTQYGVFTGDFDKPSHQGLRKVHAFLAEDGRPVDDRKGRAVALLKEFLETEDLPFSRPHEPVRRLLGWWEETRGDAEVLRRLRAEREGAAPGA